MGTHCLHCQSQRRADGSQAQCWKWTALSEGQERNRSDMADYLPAFKRLMDTSTGDDMDQLAARYAGFYRYAKILEAVAAGIRSGNIVVPK
jgi:hypothetical protein